MLTLAHACDQIAVAILRWEREAPDVAERVAEISKHLLRSYPATPPSGIRCALRAAVARLRLAGGEQQGG